MVESIETRLTLRASYSSVVYLTARSRIGLVSSISYVP